jgi:hypothetical protein
MRLLVGGAILVGLYPLLRALPDWMRTKEQREARNRLVNSLAVIDDAEAGRPFTSMVVVCCRNYEKEAEDFTRLLSWFRRWQIRRYRVACAEPAPTAVIRAVLEQQKIQDYECMDALNAAAIMSSEGRAHQASLLSELQTECCQPSPTEREWFLNKDGCKALERLMPITR